MVSCSKVQEPRLPKSINRILSTTFERIQIQQTFQQYFMQTEQKKSVYTFWARDDPVHPE